MTSVVAVDIGGAHPQPGLFGTAAAFAAEHLS